MRLCVICGKEFFHSKLRKKTCSEICSRKLKYQNNREHLLEYARQKYLDNKYLLKKLNKKKYRANKKLFKERNYQSYIKRKAKMNIDKNIGGEDGKGS